jgi:hypothetical protein
MWESCKYQPPTRAWDQRLISEPVGAFGNGGGEGDNVFGTARPDLERVSSRAACAAAAVPAAMGPNVIGLGIPPLAVMGGLSDHHWVPRHLYSWSPMRPMYPYPAQRLAEEHRNHLLGDARQWRLAHVPGPTARRRATWWPLRSGADGLVTVGWCPTSSPRNSGYFAQPRAP